MAHKITAEEARKLGLRPVGKKHPVRGLVETMLAGEMFFISREDFKWKSRTPMFFCNQISHTTKKKFTVMKTQNKNGWVVERVE